MEVPRTPPLPPKRAPDVLREQWRREREQHARQLEEWAQQLQEQQQEGGGFFEEAANAAAADPGVDMEPFGEEAQVPAPAGDEGEGIASPVDHQQGDQKADDEPPLGGVFADPDAPAAGALAEVAPVAAALQVPAEQAVPLWRQYFNYKRPFDRRHQQMVEALMQGQLRLDYDSQREVFDSEDRLIAYRWELLHARPAQPRVVPPEIEGVNQQGPWRLHLVHGVPMERLAGVSETACLKGFSIEVGGAGLNMVYARGYAGLWSWSRTTAKVIDVARSSKAPEGVILEMTAFTNVASVKYGGHEREAQLVQPGLATHAPRAQQWVVFDQDAELTAIYLIV